VRTADSKKKEKLVYCSQKNKHDNSRGMTDWLTSITVRSVKPLAPFRIELGMPFSCRLLTPVLPDLVDIAVGSKHHAFEVVLRVLQGFGQETCELNGRETDPWGNPGLEIETSVRHDDAKKNWTMKRRRKKNKDRRS
jgi:hypothetical protein